MCKKFIGGIKLPNVFVYGTLRRGERNHHYLDVATCIYHQSWIRGTLYDTTSGYPAMQESKTNHIYGEIYEVSESQLQAIDRLEGFVEGGLDNLFVRTEATVYNDMGVELNAIIYTAGQPSSDSSEVIPSGDWLVYNYLKRDTLLYFAYGSCMDDERFKLANVDHHFYNIKGKGILDGFEFQFSRSSNDGGKGDLVENKLEKVEGIVYQISDEAITYLYKREGVNNNLYRPAVIHVSIDGKTYLAITFMGLVKSAETAPTELYGTEIIRGGKGLLSKDYIQRIQQKIDSF